MSRSRMSLGFSVTAIALLFLALSATAFGARVTQSSARMTDYDLSSDLSISQGNFGFSTGDGDPTLLPIYSASLDFTLILPQQITALDAASITSVRIAFNDDTFVSGVQTCTPGAATDVSVPGVYHIDCTFDSAPVFAGNPLTPYFVEFRGTGVINLGGSDGNNVKLTFNDTATVPEPATFGIAGAAALLLVLRRRRG